MWQHRKICPSQGFSDNCLAMNRNLVGGSLSSARLRAKKGTNVNYHTYKNGPSSYLLKYAPLGVKCFPSEGGPLVVPCPLHSTRTSFYAFPHVSHYPGTELSDQSIYRQGRPVSFLCDIDAFRWVCAGWRRCSICTNLQEKKTAWIQREERCCCPESSRTINEVRLANI